MTTVFIEARPKGRREGTAIVDYVVEEQGDRVLKAFKTQAEAITVTNVSSGNPSGSVAFTALNIRYMSPTGSDSANGLTPGTAWASPNHPMNCGDVIIAAPGAYRTSGIGNFGTVSSCPSTSGGIDGTGGIYFAVLLCGDTVSVGGWVSNWPLRCLIATITVPALTSPICLPTASQCGETSISSMR